MAREKIQKGDYIGFTFAGIHTSQLGLYATSNGDRYLKNLSPTIKDRTAENSGGSGSYYFGTQKTNLQFNIDLAFDSVTEKELREIQSWLSSDISELIFDERPYIKYYCKVSSVPQMQYIPFNTTMDDSWLSNYEEGDLTQGGIYGPSGSVGGRVYKGEMSIQFTAYEPYGYSVSKWLDDFTEIDGIKGKYYSENFEEWKSASGLKYNKKYDIFEEVDSVYNATVYNGGNLECDFILSLPLTIDAKTINNFPIVLNKEEKMHLDFTKLDLSKPLLLIIDSRKRLIYYESEDSSGNIIKKIANNCLVGNDFFKIPIGFEGILELSNTDKKIFSNKPSIKYNFRYI